MKRCCKCQVIKPETDFHRKASNGDGLHKECKVCRCAQQSEYGKIKYYNDIEESRRYNREKRRGERRTPETWCKQIIVSLRRRSEEQNLPFDIDGVYLFSIWPTDNLCPVLKTELLCGQEKNCGPGPSVDKVRPELGYVKGNVRIISYRANRLKCDSTVQELLSVIDYMKAMGL
jgi:hypothetical protein